MAERKNVNKYYPPGWDPSKGSLNGYIRRSRWKDQPDLRERKPREPGKQVRIEMPFDFWCGGCKQHIAMGVRFNTKKRTVGKYYSTPIYRFKMWCHMCGNTIEIQTNPKKLDYDVYSGGSRKEERWNPEDFGQILTTDREEKKRLLTDAMFKLEHDVGDEMKAKEKKSELGELQDYQDKFSVDYDLNSLARKRLRSERNKEEMSSEKDARFAQEKCFDVVKLLPESPGDYAVASGIMNLNRRFASSAKKITNSIFEAPFSFGGKKVSKLSTSQKLLRNLSSKKTVVNDISSKKTANDVFICPENNVSCDAVIDSSETTVIEKAVSPKQNGLVSYCNSDESD